MPVRSDDHCSGTRDHTNHWKFPRAVVLNINLPHPIRPRTNIERVRLFEVEQYGTGIVQQAEHSSWAAIRNQVEIRHATPKQWVPLTEVVANVEPRHHRGVPLAGVVHPSVLCNARAIGLTYCSNA